MNHLETPRKQQHPTILDTTNLCEKTQCKALSFVDLMPLKLIQISLFRVKRSSDFIIHCYSRVKSIFGLHWNLI
jgi:hypothetical protein